MGKLVVSENVSLDGVVQDPTGEEGFTGGGWFNQIGDKDREQWAKIELEEALAAAALLLGRRSDEFSAARWPSRRGAWADRLNALPKYVVSSTLQYPSWNKRVGFATFPMTSTPSDRPAHGPRRLLGYRLIAVRCWVCDELAHGVCRFCGRAVCKDHAKTKSFLFEAWQQGERLHGLAVQDALFCGVCNPRPDPVDLQFLVDATRPPDRPV